MAEAKDTAHRLAAYTDAVFAVIVTIMVLEPVPWLSPSLYMTDASTSVGIANL
jgi:uncharacterized membrane protein